MKRLLALILCIAMMPAVGAFAADKVLIADGFDGYATNNQAFSFTYKGDPNTRVVEDGRKNKALTIPSGSTVNTLTFEINGAEDMFVFSTKLRYEGGKAPIRFVFNDEGGTEFVPFTVGANGAIVLHSGKKIGGVQLNNYTKIDIGINTLINRYFVMVNGRIAVSNHLFTSEISRPTKLQIKTSVGEEDSEVYIDDLAFYNGESVRNDISWGAYNNDTLEFAPIDMKNRQAMVFVNNDFDTKGKVFSGISPYNKSNIIEHLQYTEDNGCLLMDKTLASTDPFIDIGITGADPVLNFVMEVDITSDKLGSTLYLFNVKSDTSGWAQTFRVTPLGEVVLYNGASLAKITKGEFVKLAAVCKIATQTMDVYVNHEKVFENIAMSSKNFGVLNAIRIQQMPNQGNGRFILDNLKVYEATEPYTLTGQSEDLYSVLPADSEDIAKLSGTVAFHDRARYVAAKNQKTDIGLYPYNDGDCLMVPAKMFAVGMGLGAKFEEKTGAASLGSDIKMTIGKQEATAKGKKITLDKPPVIKDGVLYLPVKSIVENALEKHYLRHMTCC